MIWARSALLKMIASCIFCAVASQAAQAQTFKLRKQPLNVSKKKPKAKSASKSAGDSIGKTSKPNESIASEPVVEVMETPGESEELPEAERLEQLRRRFSVKEDYLKLTTEYRSHMSAEIKSRLGAEIDLADKQGFQLSQTELLPEFRLRLRLDNRSPTFTPSELAVAIDGTWLGTMPLTRSAAGDLKVKWYDLDFKQVPVGERLFRFQLTGIDRSPVGIEHGFDKGERALEAYMPIFVSLRTDTTEESDEEDEEEEDGEEEADEESGDSESEEGDAETGDESDEGSDEDEEEEEGEDEPERPAPQPMTLLVEPGFRGESPVLEAFPLLDAAADAPAKKAGEPAAK